jgi:putative membrane protein
MDSWIQAIKNYLGREGALDASISAFTKGFPTFALHGSMTVVILLLGLWIHTALTPYRELKLVQENNAAAGLSLGGSAVSLAVPLAFAMASSLNWADILIWGIITVVVQLIALRIVDIFILPDLAKRIRHGEVAAASVLVGVKLAFGFILAAAVAGVPLARF